MAWWESCMGHHCYHAGPPYPTQTPDPPALKLWNGCDLRILPKYKAHPLFWSSNFSQKSVPYTWVITVLRIQPGRRYLRRNFFLLQNRVLSKKSLTGRSCDQFHEINPWRLSCIICWVPVSLVPRCHCLWRLCCPSQGRRWKILIQDIRLLGAERSTPAPGHAFSREAKGSPLRSERTSWVREQEWNSIRNECMSVTCVVCRKSRSGRE